MRVDSGVGAGDEVSPTYDPMIAKLIVWDVDREAATRRMLRALGEYEIGELKTLIPFHQALLATEQWAQRRDLPRPGRGQGVAQGAGLPGGREAPAEGEEPKVEREYAVEVSGQALRREGDRRSAPGGAAAGAGRQGSAQARRARGGRRWRRRRGRCVSPLQGTVLKVAVEKGARSRRAR